MRPAPEFTPLDNTANRSVALDSVRGLGLVLILFSNIQEFALPRAGFFHPSVYGDFSLLNQLAWHFDHLFCNEKSLLIFGLVFGAGMVLADNKPGSLPSPSHRPALRRLVFLGLIGVAHSYIVWDGDILLTLALGGMICLPLGKWPNSRLLPAAGILILIFPFLMGLLNSKLGIWDLHQFLCLDDQLAGSPGTLESIIADMRGSYSDQLLRRAQTCRTMQLFVLPYHLIWPVSGSIVLGMVMTRSKFMTGGSRTRNYRLVLLSSILIGLPLTHLNLHHALLHSKAPWVSFYISAQYEWWVAFLVGPGWIAAIHLAWRKRAFHGLLGLLAQFGRMSLSNYLGQSLIGTFIFYGFGLGLFAKLDRMELMVLAILILGLQIIFSHIWLKRFSRGPAEWCLRKAIAL